MKTKLILGVLSALLILGGYFTVYAVESPAAPATASPTSNVEPVNTPAAPPAEQVTAPAVDEPVAQPEKPTEQPSAPATPEAPAPTPEREELPSCSLEVAIGSYCRTTDPAWWDLKAKMVEHLDTGQYVVTVAQADNPQVIIMPDGVRLTFPVQQ